MSQGITVQPGQVIPVRTPTLEVVRMTERALAPPAAHGRRGYGKHADQAVEAMRRELTDADRRHRRDRRGRARRSADAVHRRARRRGGKTARSPRSTSRSIRSKARTCAHQGARRDQRDRDRRRRSVPQRPRYVTCRRSRSAGATRRASSISTPRRRKTSATSPRPRA